MAEIMGVETGIDMAGFAASTFGYWILVALIILVLFGFIGGFMWWYFQRRLYKFKIVVFENIAGQGWKLATRDTAKFLRLSKDGTEVFWLKKKKMPLTAYGKKMGTNQYWFAVGQDGSYYNIVLGDLDAKMGTLDIEMIDRDVKYATVAMRRNAAENYGPKISWMDKYGSWLLGGITLLILFGGIYFMLNQIGNISTQLAGAANEFAKVAEPISKALGHIDSICSGGSGLIPA